MRGSVLLNDERQLLARLLARQCFARGFRSFGEVPLATVFREAHVHLAAMIT
jgi:hypothetical protein